ncbi:hypothetical protein [Flavobacterium praedii]|uniref:hypothetical protein n=1 Tax=Flavobacterium praedii TaxID=3002900 RepID=UPI002481E47A|nr:hypothetical protein [Flavobacterium praedii]
MKDKNVSRTVEVIENLFNDRYYEVDFDNVAINKAITKTHHNHEGFHFEISKMILTSSEDAKDLIDRDNETIFFNDSQNKLSFKIKDCRDVNISVSLTGYTSVSGYIKDLKFEKKDYDQPKCFRAVILTKEKHILSKLFSDVKSLKIDEAIYGSGLLSLEINNLSIDLFSYHSEITDRNYFIVETNDSSNYEDFTSIIDELILAILYLDGKFLGNSVYFLGSETQDFQDNRILGIKRFFDELSDGFSVIPDVHFLRHITGNVDTFTNSSILKSLTEKIISDIVFKRTVLILCQAHSEPYYVQASLYSVALETISNIISSLIEEKSKPIQDKTIAKRLRDELKTSLSKFQSEISAEAFIKINGDIERINSLTNKQKLLLPFTFYNCSLTEMETTAIQNRNDFLHGRIPDNADRHHLPTTVGRLLFCVNCLVMKYLGYEGYIFHPSSMYQFNNKLKIERDLLVKI